MTVGAYGRGIWRLAASGGTRCLSLSPVGSSIAPGQRAIPEAIKQRPQQDSNLRSRLRRAVLFRSLTCVNAYDLAILARCGARAAWSVRCPGGGCEVQ